MDPSTDTKYWKVRAVPQTYRGTRFRSTLEADWAATLDALNIAWQYEPEAVELPSGEFYRPDFYLPQCTTWLEVKGPHDDRLHKAMELGEEAYHHPECDGVWRGESGSELEIRVYDEDDWKKNALHTALTNAPDGDTQVSIVMWTLERNGIQTVATHRLRRRIRVNRSVANVLREDLFMDLPCCEWQSNPWRLVMIGRAPISGSTVWESAQGIGVVIIECTECGQHSFFDETWSRNCRRCGSSDDVDSGIWWFSGDERTGEYLEFVRAPRRSGVR